MSTVWFLSDMHFGHDKIRLYENRPFKSVTEMDEAIIANWNSRVGKDDEVFVAGDVSFYDKEKTREIIQSLNGGKTLILGNHDRERSKEWWLEVGFNEVISYPIIYKGFFIISHEPMYLNANMPYANIHGHIHSQKFENPQYVNVSVECVNYSPISFEEIVKRFEKE
jgi:calcineurin-like phosphoesterase family protein